MRTNVEYSLRGTNKEDEKEEEDEKGNNDGFYLPKIYYFPSRQKSNVTCPINAQSLPWEQT